MNDLTERVAKLEANSDGLGRSIDEVRDSLSRHDAHCNERQTATWKAIGEVRTEVLGVERKVDKLRILVITAACILFLGEAFFSEFSLMDLIKIAIS